MVPEPIARAAMASKRRTAAAGRKKRDKRAAPRPKPAPCESPLCWQDRVADRTRAIEREAELWAYWTMRWLEALALGAPPGHLLRRLARAVDVGDVAHYRATLHVRPLPDVAAERAGERRRRKAPAEQRELFEDRGPVYDGGEVPDFFVRAGRVPSAPAKRRGMTRV